MDPEKNLVVMFLRYLNRVIPNYGYNDYADLVKKKLFKGNDNPYSNYSPIIHPSLKLGL